MPKAKNPAAQAMGKLQWQARVKREGKEKAKEQMRAVRAARTKRNATGAAA